MTEEPSEIALVSTTGLEIFQAEDLEFLRSAVSHLESPNFLVQAAEWVGKPIEKLIGTLPDVAKKGLGSAVQGALERGLTWVATGVESTEVQTSALHEQADVARRRARRSRIKLAATGAAGGLTGSAGLWVELPVSTLLILRSIAQIAADMGHDPSDPSIRMECLSVLSLGSRSRADDALDSAYLASRIGLSKVLGEATRQITTHGVKGLSDALSRKTLPAVSRLLQTVSVRFQAIVADKAAAQAVPVLGAIGGAAINAAFAHHFNSVALYHFGMRRLEAEHGQPAVEKAYRALLAQRANAS